AYVGYRFGREEEKFQDVLIRLKVPVTDELGITQASGNLGELPDTSLPLKADIRISVDEPGGRNTTDTISLPIHNSEIWLGVRPRFVGGWVKEDSRASFEVIALDADGRRIARSGLRYEFQRETPEYSWYQSEGNWTYESNTRSRIISAGSIDIED